MYIWGKGRAAGRVGSDFLSAIAGRVGSGQRFAGLGRVGSKKSDPWTTLLQLHAVCPTTNFRKLWVTAFHHPSSKTSEKKL